MAAGYKAPETRTLPVSGTYRFIFSAEAEPFNSVQLMKPAGTMDATYQVFTSNVAGDMVPGYNMSASGTYRGSGPISGSAYNGYWAREAGSAGQAFTGSVASDPAASFMIHLSGNARFYAIEVSSGFGGTMTAYYHRKS